MTGEILVLLEDLKSKKTRSVKEAFKSVTRGAWKSSRMKELQEKLAQVHAELQLQFAVVTRYVSFTTSRFFHSFLVQLSQLPISLKN
ncbi:MAG: hypothetical protein CL912_01500 [Deltaproteobacteria bacterium]|nr:hypothetical protein [Deltaproteobacteria bacterium]